MSNTDQTRTPEAKAVARARRAARVKKYEAQELDLAAILADVTKAGAR